MFRQKKFLNTKELQDELDAWSDDDANEFNIVITPPEDVDEMADNEDLDDDIQIMNLPTEIAEVAGGFEVEYNYKDENPKVVEFENREHTETLSNASAKWSRSRNFEFPHHPSFSRYR